MHVMPALDRDHGIEPLLVGSLTSAAHEVFETMVFRSLTAGAPLRDTGLRPPADIVGTVGFTGDVSGLVTLYATLEAAREIAGAMLALDPAGLDDEIADAIGELANMVTGVFRTKLAGNGRPWAISVPTVVVGTDLYTKYLTAGRRVLRSFGMGDHEIFIELVVAETPLNGGPQRS